MRKLRENGQSEGHFADMDKVKYPAFCKAVNDTGYVTIDSFMKCLHKYLCNLSIGEAVTSENYVFHMLAMFDRRLGKRKISDILNKIEEEPEWFRKFVLIRAESEGMIKIENYGDILIK